MYKRLALSSSGFTIESIHFGTWQHDIGISELVFSLSFTICTFIPVQNNLAKSDTINILRDHFIRHCRKMSAPNEHVNLVTRSVMSASQDETVAESWRMRDGSKSNKKGCSLTEGQQTDGKEATEAYVIAH